VTNPHTRAAIRKASLAFCSETNATTGLKLEDALVKLRSELQQGIVDHGEALPQLRERVKSVFTDAETWRAQAIAATEASRAVHAAQLAAAEESGVVAGLDWLLSDDACPLCKAVATQAKQVKLGEPFAHYGDNPAYSTVRHPPLHPNDQCTVVEVLKPEYGGPENPQWSDPVDVNAVAEEAARAKADARAKAKAKADADAKAKATAIVAKPVVPGLPAKGPDTRPIGERIAAYDATEKLDALKAIAGQVEAEKAKIREELPPILAERKAIEDSLWSKNVARNPTPAERQRLKDLNASIDAVAARIEAVRDSVGDRVAAIIRAKPGFKTLESEGGQAHPAKAEIHRAEDFLGQVVTRGSGQPILRVGYHKIASNRRAFCSDQGTLISLGPPEKAHTVIHEWGHAIEGQWKGVGTLSREFLEHRVGDEKPRSLAKVMGRRYGRDETGREDHFEAVFGKQRWYVGKHYEHGTEILSMGIEKLYQAPTLFAEADPEYCKFVLGVLDGTFR
jgi:hypothetical protein